MRSSDDKQPEFSDSTFSVQSGGIDIAAQQVSVGGDVVGRDKVIGYTADQVQALLTQISATFQPRPFDGRCPYLGLDAFGEEDADRFFGREKLVTDLIARVGDSRFVMIAGPSGSGKSSLVRAGLLHQLRRGALPGSERWLYTVLKPGRDPIEQLALAMARMAKSPDAGHYIRRNGASDADALHESAESLLSDRRDQRAVIVVDQFEETFTQAEKGLSKQRTRREADGQREQLHARYSGEKAIVAIQTLALLRGRLPPRAFGLVIE